MLDLTTITASDFKSQFFRDFSYLPVYSSLATYFAGDKTFYNNLFYLCQSDGTTNITPPSPNVWELTRGSQNDYVLDQDINNAFAEAMVLFNPALWANDTQQKLGYLYLTAHFMVTDIRRSNAGLASRPEFSTSAKTVGSVSETYELPDRFKNDAILNGYLKTGYGMKYLDMILPLLMGNVFTSVGTVNPW